jgi:hypothetical protein
VGVPVAAPAREQVQARGRHGTPHGLADAMDDPLEHEVFLQREISAHLGAVLARRHDRVPELV